MDGERTEASWLQETLDSEKYYQVQGMCHQVHCCIEGFAGREWEDVGFSFLQISYVGDGEEG